MDEKVMNFRFDPTVYSPETLPGAFFRLGGRTCRGGASRDCSTAFIQVMPTLNTFQIPDEDADEDDMTEEDADEDDLDSDEEFLDPNDLVLYVDAIGIA